MRAIRIHAFGGIATIRLDEVPRPVPGAGEVLVAVKAAIVCHPHSSDCGGHPCVDLPRCASTAESCR